MAVHKNSSEEDYLDNLLNAVLNDSNEKKQEELNNDEELLGEIEDDLFDGDISSMEALGFENVMDNEETLEEKPKKERKGLFGRKRKDRKKTDSESKQDVVFEEAESFENPPEFMEDFIGNTLMEKDSLSDATEAEQAAPAEENKSFAEEDMQELYDILGVNDTEENHDIDEISRLEEEKPKKKNKKQKKEKKKSFFGKKKSTRDDEEEISDNDLDLSMDLSNDSINEGLSGEAKEDDFSASEFSINSGMEDMGLGSLGDIFMGGEETESQDTYNDGIGMSGDYGGDYMSEDEEEEPEREKKEKRRKRKKKRRKRKKRKRKKSLRKKSLKRKRKSREN